MSLAKLTPPSTSGLVPRERLYARLDEAIERRHVWIATPPGAGKTSLVTTWLTARARRSLWYRVDADDADPASFFYYLACIAGDGRQDLPAFAPEYLTSLHTYARRFFRSLFDTLPGPFVLVFDKLHEVPADAPLHSLIATAAAELPEDAALLVISRFPPSPPLAGIIAAGAHLGLEDLRFTEAETRLMLASRDPDHAAEIHAATQGWAAGIALASSGSGISANLACFPLARRPGYAPSSPFKGRVGRGMGLISVESNPILSPTLPLKGREKCSDALKLAPMSGSGRGPGAFDLGHESRSVFDFIATEIFNPLPVDRREFLLRASLLPVITERLSLAVTEDPRGFAWLAEFQRDHMFVSRCSQPENGYEFCPLFRAFLRHRIETGLGADRRRGLLRRAASLLEQAGLVKEAAECWLGAGDWESLARLVLAHAPEWLATGRHATVLAWIERLPEPMREGAPWLMFWAAAGRVLNDPAGARADYERAYRSFKAVGDLAGQWLSWAGIAETFVFGWDSLTGLDPWTAELESLLAAHREFPTPEVEARVLAGAVALVFRRPDHPLLPIWAARALALIRGRQDVPHTAMLAHFAGVHYMWRGHTHTLDAVLEAVRVVNAPMPPLARILMGMLELVSANFRGDTAGVEAAFGSAMATVREHGVHVLDVPLIQNAGLAALAHGDADRLESLINMARPLLMPGRWLESSVQVYLEGGLALLRGNEAKAAIRANNALALVTAQGMPLMESHVRLFLAHLELLSGKGRTMVGELESTLANARSAGCDLYVAAALLTLARVHLAAGDRDKATVALREGLTIGARWGYGHLFLYASPDAESQLCAMALELDIEPRHVRRLIQQRHLLPPENAGECWPWPVRIYTLGGFRVVIGGEALRSPGKPQKKPLELLKALVAHGAARPTAHNLAAQLWPDADDASLKKTLEITLHRLRKLLGSENAVLLREGRLALNAGICWVDLRAFEQAADRVLACLRAPAPDLVEIERESAHALRLYVSSFLAAEEVSSWLLPARDRAHSRFQRLIAGLGRRHEQTGRWDMAADLYRRGIEQDNLDEFLYRRLIYCLQAQGQHAEALKVYRRCRELLSIVLGVVPSAETETLIRASREI